MEWIVLLIVCAGIASLLGSRKKMGISSFFYGLILGPLGVILVYISKGKKIPCPFCKNLNYITSDVCVHCGKEIPKINKPK